MMNGLAAYGIDKQVAELNYLVPNRRLLLLKA
jgi:hypothetical protein